MHFKEVYILYTDYYQVYITKIQQNMNPLIQKDMRASPHTDIIFQLAQTTLS